MSSDSADNTALPTLISEIFNVLSHEMRTPLAVITNELSCLEAQEPSDEITAIKNALKEIVEILNYTCAYQRSEGAQAQVTATELSEALEQEGICTTKSSLNPSLTLRDKKSFARAIENILKSISSEPSVAIRIDSNHLALDVACRATRPMKKSDSFELKQFMLNEMTSPLTLMLAELILKAHGAQIMRREDGITIALKLCEPSLPSLLMIKETL